MQGRSSVLCRKSAHPTGQERRGKIPQPKELMKLAMLLPYSNRVSEAVDRVVQLESRTRLNLRTRSICGRCSFSHGIPSGENRHVQIGSGILPIYSRTPTLLAMTAVGMDEISNGRFVLGLGASGPQVIEGFHGIPYKAPLGHTREAIEICRRYGSERRNNIRR